MADLGSQGRVHVVADRHNLLLAEKIDVFGHCGVENPVVFRRTCSTGKGREIPVAVLLEPKRRVRTRKLAPHDCHLLLPGIGDEVHVVGIPRVVVGSDARWSGFRRRLILDPLCETIRRVARASNRVVQIGARARYASRECVQVPTLPFHRTNPHEPEVRAVPDEVSSRLVEQCRDGPNPLGELGGVIGGEGVVVRPEIDPAVDDGALVRRYVAPGGKHHRVEGGVVGPRPADPVVEIETVHLTADQPVVDLLLHRPSTGIDRVEASLECGQLAVL